MTTEKNDNIESGKKKLPTMLISGKEYVQVKDRLLYFSENYPNGKITTEIYSRDGKDFVFKATVTPDVKNPDRYFTGHSHDFLDSDKAMEKLESVAVGRCLANMGIGIIEGDIASAEEMQRFEKKQKPKQNSKDVNEAIKNFIEKGDGQKRTGEKNGKQWIGIFYKDGRSPIFLNEEQLLYMANFEPTNQINAVDEVFGNDLPF